MDLFRDVECSAKVIQLVESLENKKELLTVGRQLWRSKWGVAINFACVLCSSLLCDDLCLFICFKRHILYGSINHNFVICNSISL